jgi:predicted house-cleaning noncanonical NTP pyrophosphatase (MazG superfamily)
MRVDYNKLVRDRIPEIIEAHGDHAVTRLVEGREYLEALLAKLVEEAREAETASADELPKELADAWEVLQALLKTLRMTENEVAQLAAVKRSRRGGFAGRVFLEYTDETGPG